MNAANTVSFGQDTATMFFQERPYFTGDKIKVFTPKFPFDRQSIHYVLAAMRKAFSLFTWGSGYDVLKISEVKIQLPVLRGGGGGQAPRTSNICPPASAQSRPRHGCAPCATPRPDYSHMEAYIRAQRKLAVRDVAARQALEAAALARAIGEEPGGAQLSDAAV